MANQLDTPRSQTPFQRYWEASRRPLISLVFVSPLLLIYEVGVLLPTSSDERNAADVWLRDLLGLLGFGQYLLLPLLTCGILLAWHHVGKYPWRPRWSVLWGMLVESILFAILLIVLANLVQSLFSSALLSIPCSTGTSRGIIGNLVLFCGAGIYEELLFRLMLVPALWWLFAICKVGETRAPMLAIIVSSLLFSAAHYYGPSGDELQLLSFVFRFAAGIFFSFLFYYRGFGITAVSHTLYDIAVTFFL